MIGIATDTRHVDCHAHIFTGGMPLNHAAWTKPAEDATAEQYEALLGEADIPRAVLAASSLHADDNRYATAATKARPNWRTTVIVEPGIDPARLDALKRDGACGIRLQLRNKPLPDLRSPTYRDLLAQVVELDWHVQLHDDARRLPPMIDAVLDAGARLVIDHFGRPGPEGVADPGFGAVLRAISGGRTWVKISAAFRLEPPAQDRALADALLAAGGPDRLLWGSDWPFVGFEREMSYARALRDFVRAVPDGAVRQAIDQTALAFYFGDDVR